MNSVILIGRLTKDVELRVVEESGMSVTNFTLAIDKQLSKDKKEKLEEKGASTADFINVVVWGRQAESCAEYLGKGSLVSVDGRIQSRVYETEDKEKRYVTEVVAKNVQFLDVRGKKEEE